MKRIQLLILLFFFQSYTYAQLNSTTGNSISTINTAAPFLLISPDARGSGLGDAGVSTVPDVYSAHWNIAKLSQIKDDYGIGVSYVPWLRKVEPGIYLASITGYKKIDTKAAIGFSLNYFNLGKTIFKDESGYQNGVGYPNEFSLEASFSQLFSQYFSLGLTGKYIHSDLTNGQIYQGAELRSGNTGALDIALFFNKSYEFTNPSHFAFGVAISNLGPKIQYGAIDKAFLPTNMRIGFSYGKTFNDLHYTNFSLEFNKPLVPTLPIVDAKGNIISGKDPNRTFLSGLLGSFSDAPGGFSDELKEITISPGFEYVYDNTLSFRTGLFLENKHYGNLKYLNFGLGLKLGTFFKLDFSYLTNLVPVTSLTDTFRISLGAEL